MLLNSPKDYKHCPSFSKKDKKEAKQNNHPTLTLFPQKTNSKKIDNFSFDVILEENNKLAKLPPDS